MTSKVCSFITFYILKRWTNTLDDSSDKSKPLNVDDKIMTNLSKKAYDNFKSNYDDAKNKTDVKNLANKVDDLRTNLITLLTIT